MEVTIIYSGILADRTGKTKEPFSGVKSLYEIRERLAAKYNGFGKLSYVISLNGVILHEDSAIKEGDQITLITPIPGG